MDFTLILAIVAILGCVLCAVLISILFKQVKKLQKDIKNELAELSMDSKLSSMFSENSSLKNIDSLTKILFNNIKQRFGLRASSYSEIIEEIKIDSNISRDLKELLIDFFDEIIRISYREQTISESEKDNLRRKTKTIIKRIERE